MKEYIKGICYSCNTETSVSQCSDSFIMGSDVWRANKDRKEEDKIKVNLCKLCSSTHLGNIALFPKQYDTSAIASVIGEVANILLKEIRKKRN